MKADKQENSLSRSEIILLIILTPIIYVGGFIILASMQYTTLPHQYLVGTDLSFLNYVIILGLDVGWVILMKRWSYKNLKVKIILTWLLFLLSAIILTDVFITGIFEGMW